ncbi:hypothetical protein PR048_009771 [Dryococelus australis]|uniref:Uncharacterized protein n=1 Tax=Dryococelus australis TaxID=614101 RepID=A0ABQ9I0U0_9NEOP|nr:hypothetical protein PR048_009771 [Dryococelus australis]
MDDDRMVQTGRDEKSSGRIGVGGTSRSVRIRGELYEVEMEQRRSVVVGELEYTEKTPRTTDNDYHFSWCESSGVTPTCVDFRPLVYAYERPHTGNSIGYVRRDFKRRFHKEDPPKTTILGWEHKLCLTVSIKDKQKIGRPTPRQDTCAMHLCSDHPRSNCGNDRPSLQSHKPQSVNELSDTNMNKRPSVRARLLEVFFDTPTASDFEIPYDVLDYIAFLLVMYGRQDIFRGRQDMWTNLYVAAKKNGLIALNAFHRASPPNQIRSHFRSSPSVQPRVIRFRSYAVQVALLSRRYAAIVSPEAPYDIDFDRCVIFNDRLPMTQKPRRLFPFVVRRDSEIREFVGDRAVRCSQVRILTANPCTSSLRVKRFGRHGHISLGHLIIKICFTGLRKQPRVAFALEQKLLLEILRCYETS